MKVVYERENLGYLPLPNVSEVVIDDTMAPDLLTPTAFVLAFTEDGRLAMATNQSRGVEFPGGHRDPVSDAPSRDFRNVRSGDLEEMEVAAVRELYEEVGVRVEEVRPLGYHRNECRGVKPDGYVYPFPVSYQQFFMGRVSEIAPYSDNAECSQPVFLAMDEAREQMNPQQWALARHAWDMFRNLELDLQPGTALLKGPP